MLLLKGWHSGDKGPCILFRGDIGKVFIKLPHRKLGIIPRLMKDINGKKTELGDGSVDSPVRKTT